MNYSNLKKSKIKKAFSMIEISIVILIIGLLIAGIAKATDMIADSKLKTARSVTKASPVNRLSNLVLWIETTMSESWKDQNRYDGAQTSRNIVDVNPQIIPPESFAFTIPSGATITYKSDAYNSLPSIKLSAEYSTSSARSSTRVFDIEASGFTIFAVVKPIKDASEKEIIRFEQETATVNNKINLKYTGGNATTFHKGTLTYPSKTTSTPISDSETTVTASAFSTIPNQEIEVLTAQADSTKGVIFSNGTATGNSVPFTPRSIQGVFKIGAGIEIFELIVVGERVNDSVRKNVEQYLFKKWGIPNDKLVAGTF
jgi:prepilin-type N-terminal cleavage/methylation domain-containing protein